MTGNRILGRRRAASTRKIWRGEPKLSHGIEPGVTVKASLIETKVTAPGASIPDRLNRP